MKLLSRGIFKNNEVTIGIPLEINSFPNININMEDNEYIQKVEDENEVQSKKILEQAKEQALGIIENAKNESSEMMQILETAKKEGYENGRNEILQEREDILFEALKIKEMADDQFNKSLLNAEQKIVDIIFAVAKKVINTEISTNKEYIVNCVKQAIEKCTYRENIILKVSVEDYMYIMGNKDKMINTIQEFEEITIKMDKSLEIGNFIIETQYGNVDASIQTKIKSIEEKFRNVINDG